MVQRVCPAADEVVSACLVTLYQALAAPNNIDPLRFRPIDFESVTRWAASPKSLPVARRRGRPSAQATQCPSLNHAREANHFGGDDEVCAFVDRAGVTEVRIAGEVERLLARQPRLVAMCRALAPQRDFVGRGLSVGPPSTIASCDE